MSPPKDEMPSGRMDAPAEPAAPGAEVDFGALFLATAQHGVKQPPSAGQPAGKMPGESEVSSVGPTGKMPGE